MTIRVLLLVLIGFAAVALIVWEIRHERERQRREAIRASFEQQAAELAAAMREIGRVLLEAFVPVVERLNETFIAFGRALSRDEKAETR